MMKIHSLETGNFMLDGGAMFGVVPKSLWEKAYPADGNNLCNLSMRCLLVETGDKKILIDAGLGMKLNKKFLSHYMPNGDATLTKSLGEKGIPVTSITDVILTHLHFDHCGGAVALDPASGSYSPAFPKARYWVSRAQWEWAMNPNPREKASYFTENYVPLKEANCLNLIEKDCELFDDIEIRLFYGHTAGLSVPVIHLSSSKTLVYTTDLFPTSAHIPVSWVCGYDTQPLISMKERADFLEESCKNGYTFFFEHDIQTECCTLQQTEKGIRPDRFFSLTEFYQSIPA